jgi:hypothetical protein
MRIVSVWSVAFSLFASACCFGGGGSSSSSGPAVKAEPTAAAATAKATQTTAPAATPPAATTAAADPYARGPDGLPAVIPSTRSKVPTTAEWDAVPKEINVARSTPLNCETKMEREWLRVSCRGKNNTGGTPTGVTKGGGCAGDTFVFTGNGVTSLVTPVLAGHVCETDFTWSDKTQKLVVSWPNGVSRPTISFKDP